MCSQCMTSPDVFNKRIGKFVLMRATKNNEFGSISWQPGEYGLVIVNDPTFYFKTEPVDVKPEWLNHTFDAQNDDEVDAFFNAFDTASKIEEEILSSLMYLDSIRDLLEAIDANKKEQRVSMILMKHLYDAVQSGFIKDEDYAKEVQ